MPLENYLLVVYYSIACTIGPSASELFGRSTLHMRPGPVRVFLNFKMQEVTFLLPHRNGDGND